MQGTSSIYGNQSNNNFLTGLYGNGHGGGVIIGFGTFTKTGGIIYGNDAGTNNNTSITNKGHAVYDNSGTPRWRNSTAGTTMNTSSVGFWEGSQ